MRKLEAGIAADELTIFPLAILILPIRSTCRQSVYVKKNCRQSVYVQETGKKHRVKSLSWVKLVLKILNFKLLMSFCQVAR